MKTAIMNLTTFSYSYPQHTEGKYAKEGYRQVLIDTCIAIYRIEEANKTVYVITIPYQNGISEIDNDRFSVYKNPTYKSKHKERL